jgi:hypothetical protein
VGVERLSEALNSLRLEASQALIDRGQFQAAVRLSTRADFVFDSSVVDLRQARQGVVDFEVLKPQASRAGRIDFSPPPGSSFDNLLGDVASILERKGRQ